MEAIIGGGERRSEKLRRNPRSSREEEGVSSGLKKNRGIEELGRIWSIRNQLQVKRSRVGLTPRTFFFLKKKPQNNVVYLS